MRRISMQLIPALVLLLLLVGLALAGGQGMPRSLVSSGGGAVAQSGLTLHSAIGQPVVGAVENGPTLCSGFLCGAEAPPVSGTDFHTYLPVVVR